MAPLRMARAVLGVVIVAACGDSLPIDLSRVATVQYVLNAPLCSSVVPVQFMIDSVLVGTDTFRVNLQPSHTKSGAFLISPGPHRVGAHWTTSTNPNFWPDMTVTIIAGATFTDSLPLYCS